MNASISNCIKRILLWSCLLWAFGNAQTQLQCDCWICGDPPKEIRRAVENGTFVEYYQSPNSCNKNENRCIAAPVTGCFRVVHKNYSVGFCGHAYGQNEYVSVSSLEKGFPKVGCSFRGSDDQQEGLCYCDDKAGCNSGYADNHVNRSRFFDDICRDAAAGNELSIRMVLAILVVRLLFYA